MTDYDRNVTAPCGCSWTLPSGQIQSRCAEHREPSQPSQPAFDVEAANAVMADAMDGLDSRGYYGLVTNRLELVWAAAMKHMAALERQLAEATIARCRAIAEPCWRTPVEMPRAPEVALRAMETACDAFGDARKQPAFDAEAAREAVHRMAEAANSGEPIAPTLEAIHAALKLVADIADMLPAALSHVATQADEIERLRTRVAELERQLAETGERLIAARGELQRQMDHRREKAAKQPKAAAAAGGKS